MVEVVRRYIDRARAYNGVASLLLTEDGADVAPETGTVRAGYKILWTVLRYSLGSGGNR